MNISAKTEYACIAILELANSFGSGRPVQIRRIAGAHGIPSPFLVQILLQLKAAGLVNSTRGASGGYQLIRDPAELTLGEVMNLVDGQSTDPAQSVGELTSTSRVLREAWQNVADVQGDMLNAISFSDLVERARGRTHNMYYI